MISNQGSTDQILKEVAFTLIVAAKCESQHGALVIITKIRLQITKFWARHDFATRSCCDLGLQGSNPNVVRDTSQYGDHSCEIVVKFDFQSHSYGPETILLKGHPVTLTFKVSTQMCATRRLNMVIIYVK